MRLNALLLHSSVCNRGTAQPRTYSGLSRHCKQESEVSVKYFLPTSTTHITPCGSISIDWTYLQICRCSKLNNVLWTILRTFFMLFCWNCITSSQKSIGNKSKHQKDLKGLNIIQIAGCCCNSADPEPPWTAMVATSPGPANL